MLLAAEMSPEGGKTASAAKPLRMLTFNVYGDWRAPNWGVPPRATGVERAIVKAQPDIVALQEVVADWWASPMFEHLAASYGVVRGDEAEAIRRAGPPPETKPKLTLDTGITVAPFAAAMASPMTVFTSTMSLIFSNVVRINCPMG